MLNVMKMKYLQVMCRVTRLDRVRNKQVRCKILMKEMVSDRVKQMVMKWLKHVARTTEQRMTERVYDLDVESKRRSGRPCLRYANRYEVTVAKRCIGETRGYGAVEVLHKRYEWV